MAPGSENALFSQDEAVGRANDQMGQRWRAAGGHVFDPRPPVMVDVRRVDETWYGWVLEVRCTKPNDLALGQGALVVLRASGEVIELEANVPPGEARTRVELSLTPERPDVVDRR